MVTLFNLQNLYAHDTGIAWSRNHHIGYQSAFSTHTNIQLSFGKGRKLRDEDVSLFEEKEEESSDFTAGRVKRAWLPQNNNIWNDHVRCYHEYRHLKEQMAMLPTINRSMNDVMMQTLTPQTNGKWFTVSGGGNYRQCFDLIDVLLSAILSLDLTPGGGSLFLWSLGQIAVSVTPFDVRRLGFI